MGFGLAELSGWCFSWPFLGQRTSSFKFYCHDDFYYRDGPLGSEVCCWDELECAPKTKWFAILLLECFRTLTIAEEHCYLSFLVFSTKLSLQPLAFDTRIGGIINCFFYTSDFFVFNPFLKKITYNPVRPYSDYGPYGQRHEPWRRGKVTCLSALGHGAELQGLGGVAGRRGADVSMARCYDSWRQCSTSRSTVLSFEFIPIYCDVDIQAKFSV